MLDPDSPKRPLVINKTIQLVTRNYQRRLSRLTHSPDEKAQSFIINPPRESEIAGVVNKIFIPFDVGVNSVLEFLTELFNSGFEYNTLCNYRFAISTYHEAIDPFVVRKHPRVSDSMTGFFNNRMPQPRYCFIWGK